ncbi:ThiF family adenylyltransferase [Leptolyngbya sp. PL-A3]|uniref:ThiF family adenylyltransferase n=1 Tax=Leptolyngbya sp. PL-A3 TaxID=2933911 RepID=UPI00329A0303
MNKQIWYGRRNSRTLHYAGRTLDETQRICIRITPAYAETFDGQVAALVLTNLLGRMSPAIAIDIPTISVHPALPLASNELGEALLALLRSVDPHTKACRRPYQSEDFLIQLGSHGADTVVHGSGWNTYIGPAPSPLTPSDDHNPFGPAFAAILAARELFVGQWKPFASYRFNSLYWDKGIIPPVVIAPLANEHFGDIWTIGVGSVGTATLYFLSLFTQNFRTTLIDMDVVEIENLDRSPIFTNSHVDRAKVDATKEFLQQCGVQQVEVYTQPLHELSLWHDRGPGTPDILISTANEFNVRSYIESGYPPLQIYGTTGKNWQAALIRHIPFKEACSCCIFPAMQTTVPMKCATVPQITENKEVDAALPFLSFAAGLMAAAEIVKLRMEGFPFTQDRILFYTHPSSQARLLEQPISPRNGCLCSERSSTVHKKMLEGTQYASLSIHETHFIEKKLNQNYP